MIDHRFTVGRDAGEELERLDRLIDRHAGARHGAAAKTARDLEEFRVGGEVDHIGDPVLRPQQIARERQARIFLHADRRRVHHAIGTGKRLDAIVSNYLTAKERVEKNADKFKIVGDAVFALFGGPDMAFDAVRCAVEIQRQMSTLDLPGGQPLELGIGIVTGDVILGSIGSRDRLDFTAIGDQVSC